MKYKTNDKHRMIAITSEGTFDVFHLGRISKETGYETVHLKDGEPAVMHISYDCLTNLLINMKG